jgi:hypothetical protein
MQRLSNGNEINAIIGEISSFSRKYFISNVVFGFLWDNYNNPIVAVSYSVITAIAAVSGIFIFVRRYMLPIILPERLLHNSSKRKRILLILLNYPVLQESTITEYYGQLRAELTHKNDLLFKI